MKKINRKEFLRALDSVRPGLANKDLIEQSTDFVFRDEEILTFNDEVSVRKYFETGMEAVIPSKELYSLLSKLNTTNVEISHEEDQIKIQAGKTKSGIKIQTEILLPVDEIKLPKKWKALPDNFMSALKVCLPAAGSDMTKPALTNICLCDDYMVATDNQKISYHELESDSFPKDPILVPATSISKLSKYKPSKYSVVESWIHFKMEDGTIFSCRLFDGEYPDILPFLKLEGVKARFRNNTREILDRAGVFASSQFDQDSSVKVSLEKGKAIFRAENDNGWVEESAGVRYSGEPVSFYIHPDIFDSMLSHSKEILIGDGAMKFEADGFCHLAALAM